jgi:hypothetical protein
MPFEGAKPAEEAEAVDQDVDPPDLFQNLCQRSRDLVTFANINF